MTRSTMRTCFLAIALATGLLAGSPAQAQMVDASDAMKLAATIQGIGWLAKLGKDRDGDPQITSKISRSEFYIQFYGCENHTKCTSVLLSSSYTVKNKMSPAQANEWNMQHRFGSMTVDSDGDPRLTIPINLSGGISVKSLEDTMDYWRMDIAELEKLINW